MQTYTHIHTLSQSGISLAEELDEAALTVRLVVLLFEGALVELLETEGTDKMLRMKLLAHGCDAAARDGFLTAGTQRPAADVIMNLTVRLTVMLEETAVDKGCETLPAHKTLWMPEGTQGRDVILQDGTSTTATFRSKQVKVVLTTVRLAILLMKSFRTKERPTLGTEKVLRMPRPV